MFVSLNREELKFLTKFHTYQSFLINKHGNQTDFCILYTISKTNKNELGPVYNQLMITWALYANIFHLALIYGKMSGGE